MNPRTLKVAVIGVFLVLAGISAVIFESPASARSGSRPEKRKKVLADVAAYKTWKLVSKPSPESSTDTFKIFGSSIGGWGGFSVSFGPEPLNSPIIFNHGFASIVQKKRPPETLDLLTQPGATLIMPSEETVDFIDGRPPVREYLRSRPQGGNTNEDHTAGWTFARVYANETAAPSMTKDRLPFPAGSIIIREKLLQENSTEPALVTVMFKRERGFSPRTNDWEFFVIDRKLTRIKDRDTVGSCASCHINAKETDWVYKTYLP